MPWAEDYMVVKIMYAGGFWSYSQKGNEVGERGKGGSFRY